jgi:hypothetical protein
VREIEDALRIAEARRGHGAPVPDTSSLSTVRSSGLLLPVLI